MSSSIQLNNNNTTPVKSNNPSTAYPKEDFTKYVVAYNKELTHMTPNNKKAQHFSTKKVEKYSRSDSSSSDSESDESDEDIFNLHGKDSSPNNNGYMVLDSEDLDLKREEDRQTQSSPIEAKEALHTFSVVFTRSNYFSKDEIDGLAYLGHWNFQAKFVRLEFRSRRINDADLTDIGTSLGPNLSNMEHLSLDFFRNRRVSDLGIRLLLNGIAGSHLKIKTLRIRIRSCRSMKNDGALALIKAIRAQLVDLEELYVTFAWNRYITSDGIKAIKDDDKVGLAKGLKKYEITHHWLSLGSLVLDDTTHDRMVYMQEKLRRLGLKEGLVIRNMYVVSFNRVMHTKVRKYMVSVDGGKKTLKEEKDGLM